MTSAVPKPRARFRGSLTAKFLIVVVPIFLALSVPGLSLLVEHELRQEHEGLATRVGSASARAATLLGRHDGLQKQDLARDVLASLIIDPAFVCAELWSADGSQALVKAPAPVGCSGRADAERLTIPVGEQGAGRLVVEFSETELVQAKANRQTLTQLVVGLSFLFAVLASAIGFRFIVGRPLGQLLSAIRTSTETGVRTALEYRGRDEFGAVMSAFNEMIERDSRHEMALSEANAELLQYQAELKQLNQELDDRIQARTAELRDREAALYESEQRFRSFAEATSDWFWEMDENLRFRYFSERFSEITGVAENQLLGKTRQETGIPNVDEEAWQQHLEDLDAHRPFRDFVHPRTDANGEVRWFSVTGAPVFDDDGRFMGYRGTGTDITLQERTENLWRESEQRLHAIMDHVPAALFLKDLEARYLLINRQFHDWFGVDPATAIGKNAYDLYPPERAERYAMGDRKILSDWEVSTDEVVIPGPQGGEKNYTLTKFPIFDDGRPVAFGGVMMDVTERTRAELAQRQSEDKAKMANRAKSEFLANMSHELRTPLNAIIGFSEIIKSSLEASGGDDKNLEYATDIYESGQYLLDLINDILDISKIEFGSEEPQNNEIDVPQLIESVYVLVKERAHAARVRIRSDFADDLPPLKADERKLKQILLNLMSNSIKFTEEGGEVALEVRCDAADGYAFEVRDNGIGIAANDIAKALQPFGQIDGALNRKHAGTGLGLPLAKELVEMHGGSMELQSEAGVGTTVTVRFPAERIIGLPDREDSAPNHGNTAA